MITICQKVFSHKGLMQAQTPFRDANKKLAEYSLKRKTP